METPYTSSKEAEYPPNRRVAPAMVISENVAFRDQTSLQGEKETE